MNFEEYQKESKKTAEYPECCSDLVYISLGLAGEAGEVVEKVKKVLRNHEGEMSEENKESLKYELGDVLWYVSQFATNLGFSLEDVANSNLKKLSSRQDRGVIKSEGDNR